MQPRAPIVLLMLALSLVVSGPAAAQTQPRKRPPPPRPAAEAAAPALAPAAPAPAAAIAPKRLGGLTGLTPVGDAAPACRAQCSKDRYVCHAGGDPTDCDSRWVPCLASCSAR